MATDDTAERLSVLNTHWSVLRDAHGATADVAQAARFELVRRYGGAAYRYLCAACGDADAAMDLAQEFGLRVLRGDLRGADPGRGRFRDYVKAILLNLAADHRRRLRRAPGPLPAAEPAAATDERMFLNLWRAELLDRTWEALRDCGDRQPHYEVLRWRVDHPIQTADVAARQLGIQMGRGLTASNYRQLLHRARERFAELLVREVGRSLGTADAGAVQDELAELELLSYCGPAVTA